MRAIVKDFVATLARTLTIREPIVEFGAWQAQRAFADLRPLFLGRRYVGCDLRTGPGVDLVADVQQSGVATGSAGCVVMIDALEHVQSPERALAEVHRMLAPGGALIVTSVMNYPVHDVVDYWRFTGQAFTMLLGRFGYSLVEAVGEPAFPHTVVGIAFKDAAPSGIEDLVVAVAEWRRQWSRVTSDAELMWGDQEPVIHRLRRLVPALLGQPYRIARAACRALRPGGSGRRQLPRRPLRALLPGIEGAVVTVDGRVAFPERGSLPPSESLALGAICQRLRPHRILEIGTFKGGSTLVLALNSPGDCEVVTIDLPIGERRQTRYRLQLGDIQHEVFTVGERYRGTPCEGKIRQVYADSGTLDFRTLGPSFDLIFVDGNHDYENVKSDTEKSLGVLRRGGVIVWDDYDPALGPGVAAFLNRWEGASSTYHIQGTRFAMYLSTGVAS